jgi:hypothetical protein
MGWLLVQFKICDFEHDKAVMVYFMIFGAEDGPHDISHMQGAFISFPHALVVPLAQVLAQSQTNLDF